MLVVGLACRDPSPPPGPARPAVPSPAPTQRVERPRLPPLDASRPAPGIASPTPPSRGLALPADAGAVPRGRGFLGLDDEALLARVCRSPIERIERNRGGSTVSFRVWLAGGMRALFKPQQRAEVANFRAELAAYRLSRVLEMRRVPPACGRTVSRDMLQHAADASGDTAFSQRVMTELLGRTGDVPGAMLYWVPGALEPVPGTERYVQLLDLSQPLAHDDTSLAAELSTLLLFDFVEDNVDRWSGGNILRQRSPAGEPPGVMLFMDNGASFSALNGGLGARPSDQNARLDRVQRFSPTFVRALRRLTAASLQAAMAEDPLGPCLSSAQIDALLTRRDRVVAHVDEVAAAHPDGSVYPFP